MDIGMAESWVQLLSGGEGIRYVFAIRTKRLCGMGVVQDEIYWPSTSDHLRLYRYR